jgi:phage I-like protein
MMKKMLMILKELAGAPGEFQVLPAGKIEIEGMAPAFLDEAAAREVIAAFTARGNDMVIDYEHQTLREDKAPAAGWIRELVWKGAEGLWARAVDWTRVAKEHLENREYRYFSPVIIVDEVGRVVRLFNVALTNSPRINHLQPIVAKFGAMETEIEEAIMIEKLRKLLGLAADAGEDKVLEAVTLSVNKAEGIVACKEILDALGVKADAGKEAVVGTIAAIKESAAVACKEILDALGVKADAGKDEVLRTVAALKAPAGAAVQLSQQVAALTAKIAAMEQEDLVSLALKEGKTSPEEVEKWGRELALKNPESFKTIVLSRPAGSVVPVDKIVVAKDLPQGVPADTQKQVNRLMGVDDATFAKYNK